MIKLLYRFYKFLKAKLINTSTLESTTISIQQDNKLGDGL